MKLSNIFALSVLSSYVLGAPVEEAKREKDFNVPEEAILAAYPIDDVAVPFLATADGENYVVIVNSTILDAATSSLSKRDADADAWSWNYRLKYQPISKRDADADADAWSWNYRLKYQPISKRDADADADAWSWNYRLKYQPIS